ncbi:hypothetical protein ACEPAG_4078 [Sanghuangporus baumii]
MVKFTTVLSALVMLAAAGSVVSRRHASKLRARGGVAGRSMARRKAFAEKVCKVRGPDAKRAPGLPPQA